MKYEVTFISRGSEDATTAQTHVETVQSLCESNQCAISATHTWGRRALAYPILKEHFGYYTTIEFESVGANVNNLDKAMRLNKHIIRQLITLGFENPVPLTTEGRETVTEKSTDEAPRTAEELLRRSSSEKAKPTTKKPKKTAEVADEADRKQQIDAALEDILGEDETTTKK